MRKREKYKRIDGGENTHKRSIATQIVCKRHMSKDVCILSGQQGGCYKLAAHVILRVPKKLR